jgi:hypothetical protein
MILDDIDNNLVVASVNVPTGYPPEMDAEYDALIDYVETTPNTIGVNSVYREQKYCRDHKQPYWCRAGFHFRFWFYDKEAAQEFAVKVNGRLEDPFVLPRYTKVK